MSERVIVESPAVQAPVSKALTKQQARAMRAFLWRYGREGFQDDAYDSTVWDIGVRPWPTMANLTAKGYVERVQWWGPDEGYEYSLTELGRDYMRALTTETAQQSTPRTVPGEAAEASDG